jgi:S-formylglutathione hydrolase FrmB
VNARHSWWVIAAVAVLAGRVDAASDDVRFPRGTVLKLEMPAPSLGKAKRHVRVYLPPSYSDTLARRRYPVVYLLHGWPGSEADWLTRGHAGDTTDSLIAEQRIPEILLVCPDGRGRGILGRSLYVDSYDGRWRVEDFIVMDLVAWTDSSFRTLAEPHARGIVGLSDGGSAALDLTFRHPDVFGACGGHSGQYLRRREFDEAGVLGPEPGAARLLAEHSPLLSVKEIASRLVDVTIYFDCGLSDRASRTTAPWMPSCDRSASPTTTRNSRARIPGATGEPTCGSRSSR